MMRPLSVALFCLLITADAFTISNISGYTKDRTFSSARIIGSNEGGGTRNKSFICMASTEIGDELGLTPELQTLTNAFASIPDAKMRHKQLLYMASKMQPVDPAIAKTENKVPGCLSTVYIDCTLEVDETTGRHLVRFVGDSDGLLTKGLVALLIRGLSGYTAEEISKVNPEFINAAKISQSLTPGRNNGFLNMLAVMKQKAAELEEVKDDINSSSEDGIDLQGIVVSFEQREGKPMYNEIMGTLIRILKPSEIELLDNSSQHAGHAGSKGWEESGESHFALNIEAEAFEGLSLVKRHQLIYMLIGEAMPKIHALQISAKTPDEK